MTRWSAVGIIAFAFPLGGAQDGLAEKTLADLKGATVFIKVERSNGGANGSGFLIRRDGENGYIATNAHVVAGEGERRVSVVLHSGTEQERTVAAEVVGEDPVRDLAILRVVMKDLPKPLDLTQKPAVRETQTVFVLGFPFGSALATGKRGPAVTIGKASVSSLRLDDDGEPSIVQLDGELNPGNSGGPVVTADGGLAGIAVAKIGGTRIGFAIAPRELGEMLEGRVGALALRIKERKAEVLSCEAAADLIDPMRRLTSVSLYVVRRDRLRDDPKPDAKGKWAAISTARDEVALKTAGDRATGEIRVPWQKSDVRVEVWIQARFVRKDGGEFVTEPALHQFVLDPSSAAPAEPPRREADDWIGVESSVAPAVVDRGRPVVSGDDLAGDRVEFGDGGIARRIKVDIGALVEAACWSEDGRFVYLLDRRGILRKVAVPSLREERRAEFGSSCSWLVRSKAGLLVACPGLCEVLVVDEADLTVRARIPAPCSGQVVSAPTLSVAFVPTLQNTKMVVLDLKKGEGVKTLIAGQLAEGARGKARIHTDGVWPLRFGRQVVTPDGRYLIDAAEGALRRYRIDGRDLVLEESGASVEAGRRPEVSPDSKYVCSPSNRSTGRADHPALKDGGTYVYRVGDLAKPVVTLATGERPWAVAFDAVSGRIYAQNASKQVIVLDGKGEKRNEYAFEQNVETLFLLAHPSGNKVLVMTRRSLFWVELPKS